MKNLHFIMYTFFEGDTESYFSVAGEIPIDEKLFSEKQREKFMQHVYLFACEELDVMIKSLPVKNKDD